MTGYSHRAEANIRPPTLKEPPEPAVKPPAKKKSLLNEAAPGGKWIWFPY